MLLAVHFQVNYYVFTKKPTSCNQHDVVSDKEYSLDDINNHLAAIKGLSIVRI